MLWVSIPGWLDRLVSTEDVELPARGVVLIWERPSEDDVPVDDEGCWAINAMEPPANIKTPSPTLILMNPPLENLVSRSRRLLLWMITPPPRSLGAIAVPRGRNRDRRRAGGERGPPARFERHSSVPCRRP